MAIKFTFKTKTNIRFNGQEYSSVDQMPPAIRQAYEKVMASLTDAPVKIHTSSAKIVFDGQDSLHALVRRGNEYLRLQIHIAGQPGVY